MSRKVLAASVLFASLAAAASAAPANFELDPTHTYPSFQINHLGFSEMRGYFTATQGSMSYDEEKRSGSVSVSIDAGSLSTGFAKRDEHLRSKDFFNVEKFPTLTFKSEPFQLEADKAVTVNGTLTMIGVSKPVALSVKPTKCGMRMDKNYVCGAVVSGQIKRSDWGLNTYLPFVGDDVQLQIEVEAIKK
jgi:polyisoprenoid-binding protein YceI